MDAPALSDSKGPRARENIMVSQASLSHARSRAEGSANDAIKWIARIGYAARGVVYLIIGFLALLAAAGEGGQATGSKGALSSLRDEPMGQAILVAMAIGLLCYALWRAIQAIKDTSNHGHDAKGIAIRAGLGVSAVTHTFLAIYAASIAFGWGFGSGGATGGGSGGGGGGDSAQSWSGWLLRQPGGQWILGLVGLAIAGAGIAQIVKGYKGKYRKYLRLDYQKQRWADPVCKAGLYARGVVFVIIGGMIGVAAWQHDQYEAGGLSKALRTLQGQPYGAWLLGAVAIGLVAFGVYSLIEARYRRVGLRPS